MPGTRRYCKSCDYNLAGITTACPECGRSFDPADPKTFNKTTEARYKLLRFCWRHRRVIPYAALIVAWAGLLGRFWLWPHIIVAGFVLTLATRQWWHALGLFLLSPASVGLITGIAAYADGRLIGHPHSLLPRVSSDGNMNPTNRIMPWNHGSRRYADSWFLASVEDITMRTLIMTLGVPDAAYHGSYPSKHEAINAFNSRSTHRVDVVALADGDVLLPSGTFQIDMAQAHRLLRQSEWVLATYDQSDAQRMASRIGPVEVIEYDHDLLLFRVPTGVASRSPRQTWIIYLLDRNTGYAFAAYSDEPNFHSGVLELGWFPEKPSP
ncbi:MAG: hypothetical protein AAF750_15905 [Planctomycetota bacterium]